MKSPSTYCYHRYFGEVYPGFSDRRPHDDGLVSTVAPKIRRKESRSNRASFPGRTRAFARLRDTPDDMA